MWALVQDNVASNVWPDKPLLHPGAILIEAEHVEEGWVLTDGVFSAPPPPPPPTKADLIAYANAHQWALATGGVTLTAAGSQLFFSTDAISMTLMAGKVARLGQANPPASVNWQSGPGNFVSIPAEEFIAASIAIADYIQATFDALEIVLAAIESATAAAFADIVAAAWPANILGA